MSEVGPTAWEDDNFDIRFAFFGSHRHGDPAARPRGPPYAASRSGSTGSSTSSAMTQKEVDRYAAELQRHGVESVEREVRWLSDLINAERSDDEARHPRTPPPPDQQPRRRASMPALSQHRAREGDAPWVRYE